MHFTRMGGYDGRGRPDHRARRRLLPRGREREALPRRARRPLLREHRLLVRRGDRPGGARADARAALLHELVVRAPARDRARGRGCVARSRRPEPRLLLLGWLGGRRVGLEARASVLRSARETRAEAASPRRRPPRRARRGDERAAAPVQGDRAAHRVPRDDDGRALDQRHPLAPHAVRAARLRGTARLEHEPLPPPVRRDRGAVHAVPARRARAGDPRHGAGDGLPRAHGARAERRRLLHAARGLLARRARDLRPLRHPALGRRGHHGLRPPRVLVRLRALRHPARTSSRARRGSPRPTRRSAQSSRRTR